MICRKKSNQYTLADDANCLTTAGIGANAAVATVTTTTVNGNNHTCTTTDDDNDIDNDANDYFVDEEDDDFETVFAVNAKDSLPRLNVIFRVTTISSLNLNSNFLSRFVQTKEYCRPNGNVNATTSSHRRSTGSIECIDVHNAAANHFPSGHYTDDHQCDGDDVRGRYDRSLGDNHMGS